MDRLARLRAIGEEARRSKRTPADVPKGWGHLSAGDILRLCDVAEAAKVLEDELLCLDWLADTPARDALHAALEALDLSA